MIKEKNVKAILRCVSSYIILLLVVAFIVTSSTLLFVTTLSNSLNVSFTEDNIAVAAKLTFGNIFLISIIFFAIDTVRRKYMVDNPVKRITEAADKLMRGDFSVRIKKRAKFATDDKFNEIIDCFNKMAEELGGVETLRTDFIANVSHEMKTPLAVIQNYGTLLQAPGLSEEQRVEYAKGVTDGSRRLADMMTNILKLNRLENQQIYPQSGEFDLGEQLCACLLQYENVWEKKEIEINIDIAEDVRVKADEELLSHVWNNLFSNAFKFTELGGTVTVTLTATEHYAVVQVQDTGCGMSPEVGAHIFEKFYQGDSSHSMQGNGLGLALVKRVIDILHGEISVESAVGKGQHLRLEFGGYRMDWKIFCKKMLYPPIWMIIMLSAFSMVALIIVFTNGWEQLPAACIVYVVSFYTLVVLCVAVWKIFPGYYKSIKKKINQNKYANHYLTDAVFKTHVTLYRSLAINLLYVALNVFSAMVYGTYWFIIIAVYYAIIALMRILLVCYVVRNKMGESRLRELKCACFCAHILLTVNLVLSGVVLMMIYYNRGFEYRGFMIYAVAMYTFYVTFTAIRDMIIFSRYKRPVMSMAKVINLTSALFSMLFLETAMFSQFGMHTPVETRRIMIMATGGGISIIVATISMCTIIHSSKEIREIRSR